MDPRFIETGNTYSHPSPQKWQTSHQKTNPGVKSHKQWAAMGRPLSPGQEAEWGQRSRATALPGT